MVRSRCGRARCPHRAAAPLPVAARDRSARLGIPHPSRPVAVRPARASWCGPVAVGRDVPIAPPRHRRGAWFCIPRPLAPLPPLHPLITRAARWGHRALPPLQPRNSPARAPSPCRAPPCPVAYPVAIGRDDRPPGLPARAAASARGGSPPRCAAWHPHRHACGGSPPTRLTARLRRQSRRQAESRSPRFQTPGHSRAKHGTTR